jgi:hypothetical protein
VCCVAVIKNTHYLLSVIGRECDEGAAPPPKVYFKITFPVNIPCCSVCQKAHLLDKFLHYLSTSTFLITAEVFKHSESLQADHRFAPHHSCMSRRLGCTSNITCCGTSDLIQVYAYSSTFLHTCSCQSVSCECLGWSWLVLVLHAPIYTWHLVLCSQISGQHT